MTSQQQLYDLTREKTRLLLVLYIHTLFNDINAMITFKSFVQLNKSPIYASNLHNTVFLCYVLRMLHVDAELLPSDHKESLSYSSTACSASCASCFTITGGFRGGVGGAHIYMYIMTNVHISRSILQLPLISDFISIMQTLLGCSDLQKWLNHNSKGPKFTASDVYTI